MSTLSSDKSLAAWESLSDILSQDDIDLQKQQMRTLIESYGSNALDFIISALVSRLFFSCNCHETKEVSITGIARLLEVICNCGSSEDDNSIRKCILSEAIVKYSNRDDLVLKKNKLVCPVDGTPFESSSCKVGEEVLSLLVLQVMIDGGGRLAENSSKAICALVESEYGKGTETLSKLRMSIPIIMKAWRSINLPSTAKLTNSQISIISIRYFCLLGHLAMQSNNAMEVIHKSKSLDEILYAVLLSSDAAMDPLMRLSAIDFLEYMCREPMHEERSKWLLSKRTVDCLLCLAGEDSNGIAESDPVLGGPSLRLLSKFCRIIQHDASLLVLDGGKGLLQGFRTALLKTNTSGELDRLSYIDSVSSFSASSSDALYSILHDKEIRSAWLHIGSAQAKMKAAILHSVAQVIDPPKDSSRGNQKMATISNASVMELINAFGDENSCPTSELLLMLVQKPIMEPRLAAFDLMRAICTRGVGARLMLSQTGVFEYLVNRETESSKEGRESKYNVVVAIMNSEAKNLLAENIVKDFTDIVKKGPHYIETKTWDMMTE